MTGPLWRSWRTTWSPWTGPSSSATLAARPPPSSTRATTPTTRHARGRLMAEEGHSRVQRRVQRRVHRRCIRGCMRGCMRGCIKQIDLTQIERHDNFDHIGASLRVLRAVSLTITRSSGAAIIPRLRPQIMEATEALERATTPQNRTPEMLDMHQGHVIDGKADIWVRKAYSRTVQYLQSPLSHTHGYRGTYRQKESLPSHTHTHIHTFLERDTLSR